MVGLGVNPAEIIDFDLFREGGEAKLKRELYRLVEQLRGVLGQIDGELTALEKRIAALETNAT